MFEQIRNGVSVRVFWATCLGLFLFAFAVRAGVWQNNASDAGAALAGVTRAYDHDARILLSGDVLKFVTGADPPNDASVLAHPPGYAILMAGVYSTLGDGSMRVAQIAFLSLVPVLVFMIGLFMFDRHVGLVAGLLCAVSPQLSYNAALLLPDAVTVVPILIGIYALARFFKSPSVAMAIIFGLSIGVSCWLRSNAMMLPLVGCVAVIFAAPRRRLVFSVLALSAFAIIISPITLRNYFVFGTLAPLSLGAGVNLVEGIADYDAEGRFGLKAFDDEVVAQEALEAGRPEYAGSFYKPDGIERERMRVRQAMNVITGEPVWFAGVMFRRAFSMFRFERVPAMVPRSANDSASPFWYAINMPLRLVQSIFITAVFLPLAIVGAILLLRNAPLRRNLLVLLVVPLNYAVFHSALHTEYRYIQAIQPFMLILSAVAIMAGIRLLIARLQRDRLTTA